MTTHILDFYKSVLTSIHYTYDDDGLISTKTPLGTVKPATVEGKRLVLPTKEWLNNGFGEDLQPFHPLSESISRSGTSPVLQHMQRNAKALLSFYVTHLGQQLLAVAADPSLHKDLPPSCTDYLKKLADADKKVLPLFEKLLQAAHKKNKLITVYLKNGGTYDGKKVNRLAVIRFPVMELLDGDDNNVLGVEIRPKQRKVISNLFRLIMPFGDSPEEYSAGSNNRVAPYFHAFLQAYLKAATQLNRIINRYAKPMAMNIEEIKLYSEKDVARLSDFHDQVPSLRGNEGGAQEVQEEEVEAPAATKPAVRVTTKDQSAPTQSASISVVNAPEVATQRAPRNEDKGIDLKDLLGTMRPQQPQIQVQPQVNMGYGGYGMSQPVDPRQPAWLVGTQPQQAAVSTNPFAQAVMGNQTQAYAAPQVVQTNMGYHQQPQTMGYGQPANPAASLL
jgi:hypothetical protein